MTHFEVYLISFKYISQVFCQMDQRNYLSAPIHARNVRKPENRGAQEKITVAQPVDCPDPRVIVLQRKQRKLGKTQGDRSFSKDKILTADLQINWQGSTSAQIPYTQVVQKNHPRCTQSLHKGSILIVTPAIQSEIFTESSVSSVWPLSLSHI